MDLQGESFCDGYFKYINRGKQNFCSMKNRRVLYFFKLIKG